MLKKIFYISVVVLVLAAVVSGLFIIGSPAEQRLQRFDQQRVNDLQNITWQIENYYRTNEELPKSLDELDISDPRMVLQDPETAERYNYEIIADKEYKLCAKFNLSSEESDSSYRYPVAKDYDWSHPEGEYCFKRDVKDVRLSDTPRINPQPAPEQQ